MSQKRTIPFGYTVRNGRTVIDPREAEYIRKIFKDYIDGASLKEIADNLTRERVPFTIKSCEWGKARVARIIENAKYIGSDEFDPIIEEDTYELALETKKARLRPPVSGYSKEIETIRSHVRCEKCGHVMIRGVDSRCRIRESWTCQNPECKMTVRIGDFNLIDKTRIIMNRIINNSNLIIPVPKQDKEKSSASVKLKNDIAAELQSDSPSETLILDLIAKAAAEEYKESNSQEAIAARFAKQRISMMKPQEEFNEAYFNDIVKTIYITESGTIRIITKTDAEIDESEESK